MINHNPRGVVMDLVKSGVYDEDFELVWANKRDDDGHSPSDTPNPPIPPPDEPKPKPQTQYISSVASTTTIPRTSTVRSISTSTTIPSTTAIQIFQAGTDSYIDDFTSSTTTIPTSTPFVPTTSSSVSTTTSTIFASSLIPILTPQSKSIPKITITSTTTTSLIPTSAVSALADIEGTTIEEHGHTSSPLAVIVSVTVIISVIVMVVLAIMVRRNFKRQGWGGGNIRGSDGGMTERGRGVGMGVGAFVSGMGVRRRGSGDVNGNGNENWANGDPEARVSELMRNPSVMSRPEMASTGARGFALERERERERERMDMQNRSGRASARVASTSSISSGWGDGLSIHSLGSIDLEREPVQGLGVRPQTRPPPIDRDRMDQDEYNQNTYQHPMDRDPFADPDPDPDPDPESYFSYQDKSYNTAPPSLSSEIDALERQREMEGGRIGGVMDVPGQGSGAGAGRWENPFTRDEKRGTRAYEEMVEEERREGRWMDARGWVGGQVERGGL